MPSRKTCPGRSDLCSKACYSAHLEAFRPNIKSQYEKNFRLSRRKTFVKRMIHFIESKKIEVVRIHAAGDFYSSLYTRKWLEVMKTCPQTIFYFYTRSWRVREILKVLKEIAGLKNVRAWFSCDQETGTPRRVPEGVRLAWMMTSQEDLPPEGSELVFRVRKLRGVVQKKIGLTLVCPPENGVTKTTCEQCGVCWRS